MLLVVGQQPKIKRKEIIDKLGCSKPTLERALKKISSPPFELIEYQGAKKTGGYVLTEKGEAALKDLKV